MIYIIFFNVIVSKSLFWVRNGYHNERKLPNGPYLQIFGIQPNVWYFENFKGLFQKIFLHFSSFFQIVEGIKFAPATLLFVWNCDTKITTIESQWKFERKLYEDFVLRMKTKWTKCGLIYNEFWRYYIIIGINFKITVFDVNDWIPISKQIEVYVVKIQLNILPLIFSIIKLNSGWSMFMNSTFHFLDLHKV